MNLGFIGTGEITAAMVTGLASAEAFPHSIVLSPRNQQVSGDLASRFPGVTVAASNQEVVDCCEVVVVAVKPRIARTVLAELRFRAEHQVVSVVSGLSLSSLTALVTPATSVTRAVPLPSAAKRIGPTAIYPPDPTAASLFGLIGSVFPVETEREFEACCACTATLASFYAFMDAIASWQAQNGVREAMARNYVAHMILGISLAAVDAPQRSFRALASAHATAGGISEQVLNHLRERGVLQALPEGLDAVLRRISSAAV